jgi:hypothetical protein
VGRDDPPTLVELVNNIFKYGRIACGGGGGLVLDLHHNLFSQCDIELCDADTVWGAGNVVWDYWTQGVLFCEKNGNDCDVTLDWNSVAADGADDGGPMGAWPIGCGLVPIEEVPDTLPLVSGPHVGFPLPNPASGLTRLPVRLEPGVSASIEVYDAAGRRIRTLQVPASEELVSWDGTDARGAPVPAGVYHLRVVGMGVTRTVRMVR